MMIVSVIVDDDTADAIWETSTEAGTSIWITVMDDQEELVDAQVVLDSITAM